MLVKSHANHWEGRPVISEHRFGFVEIFLGDIVGHRDVRVVREGQHAFEWAALKFLVQLHAFFEAFFDVDEHHRRDRPEGPRARDGDVERFLRPGDVPYVLAGGGPVLSGRCGDQRDVGGNNLGHGITEGGPPLLEFAGNFRWEPKDHAHAHGVTGTAISTGDSQLAGIVRTGTTTGVGLDVELASRAHGVSGLPARRVRNPHGRAGTQPWSRHPPGWLRQSRGPCPLRAPRAGPVPPDQQGVRWRVPE